MASIADGCVCVTLGPLIGLKVKIDLIDKSYDIGEVIDLQSGETIVKVFLDVDFAVRNGKWHLPGKQMSIVLMSNLGCLMEVPVSYKNYRFSLDLPVAGLRWLRAELYCLVDDQKMMAAFTNPVYFERK